MNQHEMIQSLRAEIAKLQRVVDLLLEQPNTPEQGRRPGRPKGSPNRAATFDPEEFAPQKRTMSAEGKARVAAAQKRRWATQKSNGVGSGTVTKHASAKRTGRAVAAKSVRPFKPATAKKRTGAARRAGSTQVNSGERSAKGATSKTAAKKPVTASLQRPAKQAAGSASELQTRA